MKKILSVFLTAVMLFALSGCNTGEKIGEYDNVPPIMLASVYDNWANGYEQQRITVVDNEGKIYSRYCEAYMEPEKLVEIYEDDLYERLLNFVDEETPLEKTMTAKELRRIRWNVQYFEEWSRLPAQDVGEAWNDYGDEILYGVYYDSNGMPQLTELARHRDSIKCRNSSDVKKFVNSTRLFNFELT